jgi:hypothetical protein
MTMILRRASRRVYGDFLMPSRLGLYRALLELALQAGYEVISVERLWALIGTNSLDPARRYLVLRNDIDTGPNTAREMGQIKRALGIVGSYFFRLWSLAVRLRVECWLNARDDALRIWQGLRYSLPASRVLPVRNPPT